MGDDFEHNVRKTLRPGHHISFDTCGGMTVNGWVTSISEDIIKVDLTQETLLLQPAIEPQTSFSSVRTINMTSIEFIGFVVDSAFEYVREIPAPSLDGRVTEQ